jgi:hypothetical protein
MKNLRAVSDAEFDDLVRAVRDSPDWQGIVHNTDIDPEPSPYQVGDLVEWVGPVPRYLEVNEIRSPWDRGGVVGWWHGQRV